MLSDDVVTELLHCMSCFHSSALKCLSLRRAGWETLGFKWWLARPRNLCRSKHARSSRSLGRLGYQEGSKGIHWSNASIVIRVILVYYSSQLSECYVLGQELGILNVSSEVSE